MEQRAIYQELDDNSSAASSQLTIAGLTASEGRLEEAIGLAEEAREWCKDAQDRDGESRALYYIAQFYAEQPDMERALDKARDMRECLKDFGYVPLEANACRVL